MKEYLVKYYTDNNKLLYQYGVECKDKDEATAHAENHMSCGIPDWYEIEVENNE